MEQEGVAGTWLSGDAAICSGEGDLGGIYTFFYDHHDDFQELYDFVDETDKMCVDEIPLPPPNVPSALPMPTPHRLIPS